jgi:hypothetical protein
MPQIADAAAGSGTSKITNAPGPLATLTARGFQQFLHRFAAIGWGILPHGLDRLWQ